MGYNGTERRVISYIRLAGEKVVNFITIVSNFVYWHPVLEFFMMV